MSIFGEAKPTKMELHFYDDRSFEFIAREMYNSCLIKRASDKITWAMKHFFGSEIPFQGYRNIKPNMVTLGFDRDIILDIFDKVPAGTDLSAKPDKKSKNGVKEWIAKIAENQRHIFRAKRETHVWTNRLTWLFIGVTSVELFVWALTSLMNRGG